MSEPNSPTALSKPRKRLIYAGIGVLLIGLVITGFFWYQSQYKNSNQSAQATQVLAKASGLPDGVPLTFQDSNGNLTTIQNGQTQDLPAGEYTVKTAVDGLGQIDEKVQVQDGKTNTLTFDLKPIDTNSNVQSSVALKPAETSTNLVQDNSLNGTTANQAQIANGTTDIQKTTVATVTNSNNPEQAKIEVTSPDGKKINLAQGCSITKMYLNQDSTRLRYFKNCASIGQNGFYSANVITGEETRLLDTSDPSNTQRADINPVTDDIVFIKPTGEFGFVRDNQITIVTTNTNILYPTFSPDGKYIIYGERSGQTNSSSKSFYDIFPMQVKVVSTDDFVQNKDKAEFKTIEQSYIIPTGSPFGNEFVTWVDGTHFQMGDSPRIFGLDSSVNNQNEEVTKPGRLYTGVDGKVCRQLSGALFDANDQQITFGVQKIVQIPGHGFFYIANGYLSRIMNNQPVIAFPQPVLNYQVNGDKLILLTQDGKLQTFNIAQ